MSVDPKSSASERVPVYLSTTCAFPKGPERAFQLARDLGYDGIEVLVTGNSTTRTGDELYALMQRYEVPVAAIHAPTLLFTQQVWGGAWKKIQRSVLLAHELGVRTIVVHPPFRWQGKYATGFAEGVRRSNEEYGVVIAVENMYPWRAAGQQNSKMYRPHYDPVPLDYDFVTWDFSHAAIAGADSLTAVQALGSRLTHLHVCDGTDNGKDEHLPPGMGTQPVAETLQYLGETGWRGSATVEVTTRRWRKEPDGVERVLAQCLDFTRTHLQRPASNDILGP